MSNHKTTRRTRTDLTGKRVGKLTVLARSEKVVKNQSFWCCVCECGNFTTVAHGRLNDKVLPTKSCGCVNYENILKLHTTTPENAAKREAYNRYKCETRRKIRFLLTLEDAIHIFEKNCFYCGTLPSNTAKNSTGKYVYRYSGIDRVDNTKDYIIGNVVPCCKYCNVAKGTKTHEEFMQMITEIYEFNNLENGIRN